MFNRYYQQELLYLRDLAAQFSKAHPALAPMLSGQATDPDVERLLEGVAFSTGLIRQKLDDELPEIIHGLTDLVFPHYLRPLPAASVVAFSPKPALKESMTVERGTSVASVPVEGTSCTFQTAYDVTVHPLTLADAGISEESARSVHVRLSFSLLGLDLSAWRPGAIRFFLGGDYAEAADRYLLLNRSVRRIRVESKGGGTPLILDPSHLRPAGFSRDESLIPYPGNAFSGYRLIQEYFLMPAAFLFMDLVGLDGWENRGSGNQFDVVFEMADPPFFPREIRPEHFILFATPVVNLFRHTADPIDLDHRLAEYPVRPSGRNERHYQVYSVEQVAGIIQGSVRRKTYAPFERFAATGEGDGVFQVSRKPSAIDNRTRVFLTLPYAERSEGPVRETLAVELICTNGELPQTLQLGDISAPTSESPVLLGFRNITPVTAPVEPSLGTDALWRLLSHLSLNFLPLSSADALKELLSLYVFPESRDKAKVAANRKRIEGIDAMTVTPEERLVSVHMMRGQTVHIDFRQDHFASAGDAFLFGCVLERFLSVYASINTFTRLSARDTIKGDVYQWEPRIGGAPLI